ncbi:MAG: hypothetical protein K2J73_01140 [Oscillospiraceae bacterium]|nr:hypothetical protein [Oscillospiraceae bacterium]
MNKPSDRLDFVDKTVEVHNSYIDIQVETFSKEIQWLDENFENIMILRQHLAQFLPFNRVSEISDDGIKSMAILRANQLYAQIQQLRSQKIDNRPLKVIVQGLKFRGQ